VDLFLKAYPTKGHGLDMENAMIQFVVNCSQYVPNFQFNHHLPIKPTASFQAAEMSF